MEGEKKKKKRILMGSMKKEGQRPLLLSLMLSLLLLLLTSKKVLKRDELLNLLKCRSMLSIGKKSSADKGFSFGADIKADLKDGLKVTTLLRVRRVKPFLSEPT